MSQTPQEDTSPATKSDIAAILERFDRIDHRFTSVDKQFTSIDERFTSVDERFDAIDRRFATMEKQLDDRFDGVDRRFDAVDQQFHKMLEYIRAEGKESRLHGDKLAEETQRHVDVVNKNLQDYVAGIFSQKTYLYGEKFREHDRRIRAFERGEQLATIS